MSALPRITIITPSFNQAQYLEQTIRSVLEQNYPNLEYMVVDGGSTDGSKEIIEKYADQLHWWCSQKDNGQSHALNKGLDKATGDVIAYINSDDWYLPGVLHKVGEYFRDKPKTDFLYGRCQFYNELGEHFNTHQGNIFKLEELLDLWNVWWQGRQFVQPECFWSRRVFLKVRSFREDIINAFDYEYWTRILMAGAKVERMDEDICCFRFHASQKSADAELTAREELEIIQPILWDPKVKLDQSIRLKLQADWLFHTQIYESIRHSEDDDELGWKRHLRIGKQVLLHPKILFSDRFWLHFKNTRQARTKNDT